MEIVEIEENVKIPHKEVRLFVCVFWFIGLQSFYAMPENIGFRTTVLMPNRECQALKKGLISAFDACTKNGFNAKTLYADLEFECIRNSVPTKVNVVYKDSHV